jgi:hypothetical protein
MRTITAPLRQIVLDIVWESLRFAGETLDAEPVHRETQ